MTDSFITLQDLSDALGRDLSGDPAGTAAVSSACEICRQEAGQSFNAGTSTIQLDGVGGDALILPEGGPGTVTAVSVNGVAVTDFQVTADGVLLRGTAGAFPRPIWPSGRQNVSIIYSYGWPDLEVPEDVCQVALQLARRILVQGGLKSETLGDTSVTYDQPDVLGLTKGEQRILRNWGRSRSF